MIKTKFIIFFTDGYFCSSSPWRYLTAPPSRSHYGGEGSVPGSHHKGVHPAVSGWVPGLLSCRVLLFTLNLYLGLEKDHLAVCYLQKNVHRLSLLHITK